MINCPICLHRHREHDPIIVCTQVFSTGTHDPAPEGEKRLLTSENAHGGPATIKDVLGAAAFAKKRRNPHFSQRRLQLVQLTQKIFHEEFELFFHDHVASMHKARMLAATILKKARKAFSQAYHRQQDVSRRINRGLLPGGTR